ncbi:MAG: asparagine synthase (glutamine-hydrolyzing) [Bryobacteraceae bacterium]|nr:asparagine synthase (glutamine-hydrolyzing) [Bryobacteraceae bacterium]
MCGIAGFAGPRDAGDPDEVLARMLARLESRGPDGSGAVIRTHGDFLCALGHRRLSIIDLAGGAQPLANEDGSVQVTFNGEIYNFRELVTELEARGHRFHTRSDTEVLVHLYEERGIDGLERLNGMFAFAIWDQNRGRLLLARDRFGIKPLTYAVTDRGIVFASTVAALLAHPGISRAIDRRELAGYFFADYVHAPGSILQGARKLAPGHFLIWEKGGAAEPVAFWSLDPAGGRRTGSESELASRLQDTLEASVERQLISDVPVGSFLSGGIDSSLITAIAQKKYGVPVQTFSIGFADKEFDESEYSDLAARKLGTVHRSRLVDERDLLSELDAALDSLDEPLADPSIVPTYIVSKLAAEHVKVVVGGDGGDELWAGYPTYLAEKFARYYSRIPAMVRGAAGSAIAALPVSGSYQSLEWKLKRFANRWDDEPVRRHLRWMSNTDVDDLPLILPGVNAEPPLLNSFRSPANGDLLTPMLALDFRTYLPGSVLTKVDRASMAHGLEVRPPFLDNHVVDLSFSIAAEWKLRGRERKYLLKRVAESYLPPEIIYRPKRGFAIPLAKWIAGPLRPRIEQILRDSPAWDGMNRETFAAWLKLHLAARQDFSRSLWALLVLDHWMRREKCSFA